LDDIIQMYNGMTVEVTNFARDYRYREGCNAKVDDRDGDGGTRESRPRWKPWIAEPHTIFHRTDDWIQSRDHWRSNLKNA
jgi:hypothetical protein